MSHFLDLLLLRVWWTWDPSDPTWHSRFVHWFNLFEGAAWWTFAALVLRRHFRHRRSPWELAYAAAFLIFGATDFVEASALTSWLLWVKLIALIVLWRLRRTAISRWYPENRVY